MVSTDCHDVINLLAPACVTKEASRYNRINHELAGLPAIS